MKSDGVKHSYMIGIGFNEINYEFDLSPTKKI